MSDNSDALHPDILKAVLSNIKKVQKSFKENNYFFIVPAFSSLI